MPERHRIRGSIYRVPAAALFAVLILTAALMFGAVDRAVQLGLAFGLAIGFIVHPPDVPRARGLWVWLGLALVAFVAVSQFLPFQWFGGTVWHSVLRRDYGVVFPMTRNPEPGRAVDCLLMAVMAAAWFFWVRTLAAELQVRMVMLWELFAAAAFVALVSLLLGPRHDFLIYGVRYTPGWTGFGPFPNRNHTAALLAMGALAGAGCVVRAARRRYWTELAISCLLVTLIIVALLASKSRGGLLGLGCGAAVFAVLSIAKLRNRGSVAAVLAGGLLVATLVLAFGSKLLSRFGSPGDGNIPNNLRWQIWQDAIRVWRDAPLWGHGLGTFAQIYPFYQTVQAHEQVILHPESSWLQWLDELGAIPVAAGAAVLLYYLVRSAIGAVRSRERGFFIRAGAFAGVSALLCHGLWDVPAHRWGTAAFGIALLAIASNPPLHQRRQFRLSRFWAAAPALIGLFWLFPFRGLGPDWSPEAARQTLERLAYNPTAASLEDLRRMEAFLPLDAELHEQTGLREMIVAQRPDQGWREFRIADRLQPASWSMPATQAWLSRDVSPGMSFHFWSLAIERAGTRAPDIFTAAYRNSVDLSGGSQFWRGYVEAHPEFLLSYAECVSGDEQEKAVYGQWWKARGDSGAALEPWEPAAFYFAIRKWGDRSQLDTWMRRHPELEAADYKTWASILHEWQSDADAWSILSRHVKEPAFPDSSTAETGEAVEAHWRAHPEDPISAQLYARQCSLKGDAAKSEQVILFVAAGKNPPPWFTEKAAFLYAAKKDYATAVRSLLNMNSTDS